MIRKFEIIFLEKAFEFLRSIDEKAREKILFNIDKARLVNDPKVFKKLGQNLWEFRAENKKLQYRLLAFWDKRDGKNILVICTHGFIKKTDKVASKEFQKAKALMNDYFNQ